MEDTTPYETAFPPKEPVSTSTREAETVDDDDYCETCDDEHWLPNDEADRPEDAPFKPCPHCNPKGAIPCPYNEADEKPWVDMAAPFRARPQEVDEGEWRRVPHLDRGDERAWGWDNPGPETRVVRVPPSLEQAIASRAAAETEARAADWRRLAGENGSLLREAVAQIDRQHARAERAEEERDRLRAALERIWTVLHADTEPSLPVLQRRSAWETADRALGRPHRESSEASQGER